MGSGLKMLFKTIKYWLVASYYYKKIQEYLACLGEPSFKTDLNATPIEAKTLFKWEDKTMLSWGED